MDDVLDDSRGFAEEPDTLEQDDKAIAMNIHDQKAYVAEFWADENNELHDNDDIDFLLILIAQALRLNAPLIPEIRAYLNEALMAICLGTNARNALGYKTGKGIKFNKALKNLHFVIQGRILEELINNEGLSIADARKKISDKHHSAYKTVERDHLRYKQLMKYEQFLDNEG